MEKAIEKLHNYAMIGCGHRGMYMFALPLVQSFTHTAKLVAVCDSNPTRAAYVAERCGGVPYFTEFDEKHARLIRLLSLQQTIPMTNLF